MAEGTLAAAGHAPFSSSLRSPLGLGFASLKSTPSVFPCFTLLPAASQKDQGTVDGSSAALVDSSQLIKLPWEPVCSNWAGAIQGSQGVSLHRIKPSRD